MAEITRLRQERDKNKPLYKGHCPDLDSTSYDVWKRQWKNWRSQTCLTAGQVAHATMEVIRDDNKHKKGLSTLIWRQMADQNQDSLTCEEIETFLDTQFEVDSYEETFKAWRAFIQTTIRPGEPYSDFTLRWSNAWLTLQRKDESISLSQATLATILRDAANLDEATVRTLRAAVKFKNQDRSQNTDALKDTVKVINNICAGQKAKAPAQQQVKLVTANGTAEVQYDGHCLWINGEEAIAKSQYDILVAEAKKGIKPKTGKPTKGKKGDGKDRALDPKKKEAAEKLKHIKCYGCGEFGHYKTNCPNADNHDSNIINENFKLSREELEEMMFKQGCLGVWEDQGFTEGEEEDSSSSSEEPYGLVLDRLENSDDHQLLA